MSHQDPLQNAVSKAVLAEAPNVFGKTDHVLLESVYFEKTSVLCVSTPTWAAPRIITVLLMGFQEPRSMYSNELPPSGGRTAFPLLKPLVVSSAHVPGGIEAARLDSDVPVWIGGVGTVVSVKSAEVAKLPPELLDFTRK
jgi:hypothetical protein